MEHLQSVLEKIEELSIPEGDYLAIANALKKVSESLNTTRIVVRDGDVNRDVPSLNPEIARRLADHFTYDSLVNLRIIDYDFTQLPPRLTSGTNTSEFLTFIDYLENKPFDPLSMPNIILAVKCLHDNHREAFLLRSDRLATLWKREYVRSHTAWKFNLIRAKSFERVDETYTNPRRHILSVDVKMDHLTESFRMPTKLIALGRSSVCEPILHYYYNYLLSNGFELKKAHIEQLKDWRNVRPHLVESGITHNTRDKRRTYVFDTQYGSIRLQYISKLNTGGDE